LGFGPNIENKLFLVTPDLNAVIDGVTIAAVPRGRPDDSLAFRYPDKTTPGEPNVFVEHDEIVIHEIMYHARPRKLRMVRW
jgi:hypothetical protein